MSRRGALLGLLIVVGVAAAPAASRDSRLAASSEAVPLRGVADWSHGEDGLHFTSAGSGSRMALGSPRRVEPPLDLTDRSPVVRVRIDDMTRLAGAELVLFSREGAYSLPVSVFGDESFNLLRSGEWLDLSLSFATARVSGAPERSAIERYEWRVTERGSEGQPLSGAWGGLFSRPLPQAGVVSLTFDDGYDEHLHVAASLMAEHGMRGTAYVMPEQVGEAGYMDLVQLRVLRERFGWDVAAHHLVPLTDLPGPELPARLDAIQHFLLRNGFGEGAAHLAYPLGKYEPDRTLPAVRTRFATARLASGGTETLPPADPHRLRVMNVVAATRPDEIREAARRAREERAWLILMFHFLVEEPQRDTEYAISDFREALAGIAAEGVDVAPVSEVWRRSLAQPADAARP